MSKCLLGGGAIVQVNKSAAAQSVRRHNILIWGVIVLTAVYIGRVQEMLPFLSSLHIGKVAVLFALALFVLAPDKGRCVRGLWSFPQIKCILGITLFILLSVPYSHWPGLSFGIMVNWFKALLFIVLIVISVHSEEDVKKVLWAFVIIVTMLLLYSFVNPKIVEKTRITVTGTYDANDFALFLVMALPVMFYLMTEQRGVKKMLLWTVMAIAVVTIVKTGSRGGFLGLAVVGALILYRMGLKYSLKLVPLVVVAALILSFAVDESHTERLKTILDLEEDYNVSSAVGRVQVWKNGIELMLENPYLGVGAGAFPVAEGSKHEGGKWSAAHNTFIQIGAELGIAGLLLFSFMIFRSIHFVRKYDAGLPWLQRAIEASLLGFCVGGFFLSWAYSYVVYFFVCLAVVYMRIYRQRVFDETERAQAHSVERRAGSIR